MANNLPIKRLYLLFLIFAVSGIQMKSFGQEILVKKVPLGGLKLYNTETGEVMNMTEAQELMDPNAPEYGHLNKARAIHKVEIVLSATGGYLIGFAVGTMLSEVLQDNWTFFGVGAGLVLISFSVANGYKQNLLLGVELHNRKQKQKSSMLPRKIGLTITNYGPGIVFRF